MTGSHANQNNAQPKNRERRSSPDPLIPENIAPLLGKRPIIYGEKADDFDRVLSTLAAEINPKGFIEWQLVWELTICWWDSRRYKIAKANLINSRIEWEAKRLVASTSYLLESPLYRWSTKKSEVRVREPEVIVDAVTFIRKAQAGGAKEKRELDDFLGQIGYDQDRLAAEALVGQIDIMEYFDRVIANLDRRRDVLLKNIERRHLALGQRLRNAASQPATDLDPGAVI